MKLEDPLLSLVRRCQTICVAECCGLDAYDFSPVHIASYLLMFEGRPNQATVTKLRAQLQQLKIDFGSSGALSSGVIIDDMNQVFYGTQIDVFVDEIMANLPTAIGLCAEAEKARYKHCEQE